MFPGSGHHSYNNYGPPQGPPPGNYGGNYGPPQGPPPGNYGPPQGPPPGNYGPPQGPPPGNYGPPQGPPPGNYGPPQGPPPGNYGPPSHPPSRNDGHSRPPAGAPQHYSNTQDQDYNRPMAPPPSAPQSFGQDTGMTFQYSNCSGKKKALLVGINYFGSRNELRGCINDVKNMSNFLVNHWGYKWEDIVILTDDQREMARIPTKANMLRAMQWLVKDAQPHDSLVFHYSGHGGQTEDLDGDEESGFDDVVYPLDFEQAGHILDDEMHEIMVRPLPPGCRLTALFDSCHSGTALDLPYVYSTKGVIKEPNLLKDTGVGALNAFMSYESGNIGGAIKSLSGIVRNVTHSNAGNRDRIRAAKASPADVISMSGCKDDQTSADAQEAGQATGAMSWAFIKVLNELPNQTYLSLLNNMRTILAEKYSQKPQLSCSHPQDMNIQFVM